MPHIRDMRDQGTSPANASTWHGGQAALIDSTDDALWFMGDLSDSWVVSIAGALSHCTGIVQVHSPGDLPERPFDRDQSPRLIVIHRHRFTASTPSA